MKIKIILGIIILAALGIGTFAYLDNVNKYQERVTPETRSEPVNDGSIRDVKIQTMSDQKPMNPPTLQFDTIEATLGVETIGKTGVTIMPLEVIGDQSVRTGVSFKGNKTEYLFEKGQKMQTSFGDITLTGIDRNLFHFSIVR